MKSKTKWYGMHWIRDSKRIAIYLRDGLACVYCGTTLEEGKMSVDHIRVRSRGGSNSPTNLVTACLKCNKRRGERHLDVWLDIVVKDINPDTTVAELRKHIRNCTRRVLPIEQAKIVLANRIAKQQEEIENK
jgi:hypothetical protein